MLARQMQVDVASVGEHVVLTMGSSKWTLHYEAALKLSAGIRLAARAAKRMQGDYSWTKNMMGTLHDAEKGPDFGQPFTPGKLYPVARNVVKNIATRNEGRQVVMKLGSDEAKMHYKAAQTLGQWIRLRAKESKRRAGDIARHWSVII